MNPTEPTAIAPPPLFKRPVRGVGYIPTVGPRLRVVLMLIFLLFAFLGATGVYLASISTLEATASAGKTFTTHFSLNMLWVHIGVGVLFLVPFLFFGIIHYLQARTRPNRSAVRRGLLLFTVGLIVCASGLALIQLDGFPQLPTKTASRIIVYWLHVLLPIAAIGLYVAHRRAGPVIRWKWGYAWLGTTVAFVVAMAFLHGLDPRTLNVQTPREGLFYFHPSAARTDKGDFIPATTMMMDEYCKRCHEDIYNDHLVSAHRFSSFNNPPYLFSVNETREFSKKRDGNVKASRWCAGCHDTVPLFSGAFDDANFDVREHPTSQAGLSCTSCHSITSIHGAVGNGAYTIENPQHYPFAFSNEPALQWINNQLVKAKPDLHKKTFLKPFHRTSEFCATCHKVALPVALNHYKEFLRGQNHYDSFLLSGVSGHGSRSFYYPPEAKGRCADCHMPLKPSNDFGAKDFDGTGVRKVHHHGFPGGNTGLPYLLSLDAKHADKAEALRAAVKLQADFLRGTDPEGKDKKLRIDLFGLKAGGTLAPEKLIAPLRPNLPALKPGEAYVIEVVVRNLGVGHHFPQGTADSNEIWVDFKAENGGKVIARNGALSEESKDAGTVDEWSHFINVLMLDRNGNRINRRNPQDIFTPLYDHQIPPGSAIVVHYRLDVPAEAKGSVKLHTKLRYRKFDYEYMKLVYDDLKKETPTLPIVDICEDEVTLPIEGSEADTAQKSPIPVWQRWNDYGIGNLLEGGAGSKKGNFRQAEASFRKVTQLGVADAVKHGHVNLARVYIEEGRYGEAGAELEAARTAEPPADWWTIAWFGSIVNSEQATSKEEQDAVIADLERLVDPNGKYPEKKERGFDFSKDYVVLNRLANRLLRRSQSEPFDSASRKEYVERAVKAGRRVLELDVEDVAAHNLLYQCYAVLGTKFKATEAGAGTATPDELAGLSLTLADGSESRDSRLKAASRLVAEITAQVDKPADPAQPRLGTLREMIARLGDAYESENDKEVAAAIARVLAGLHLESHSLYKPDENARSNATSIYRASHPAANYAERGRVIYPTTPAHREAILKTGNIPGSE